MITQIKNFLEWLKEGIDELNDLKSVPIAPTPKTVILQNGPTNLFYYGKTPLPSGNKDAKIILLVPSLINRPFIFDLLPKRSFIEYLVENDFEVFLQDWGIPGDIEKYIEFEDYIFKFYHEAVEKVKQIYSRRAVPILGYCIGGTLSMVYSGLFPNNVSSLVNLATPSDFSNAGILRKWVDSSNINVEAIVKAEGNVPPEFMYLVFSLLKPTSKTTAFRIFMERREDKNFNLFHRAMEHWTSYNIPFPGQFAIKYINDFYINNRLIKNNLVYRGHRIDLTKYKNPFLNIYAKADHIVPISAAKAIENLIGSEQKESWEFETGHVGLLVGSFSIKNIWPKLKNWLVKNQ